METLVKSLGLLSADAMVLVNELKDWETKGIVKSLNFKLNALTFTERTFLDWMIER